MRFRLVPKSVTLDDLERPKRHSCGKKSVEEVVPTPTTEHDE